MKYLICFILCVVSLNLQANVPRRRLTRFFYSYDLNYKVKVRTDFKPLGLSWGQQDSVNGRVAVDDRKDEVSNLILDVKPVITEESIVKNQVERNSTNDNLINANLIFDIKANTTEATIVKNKDERNDTSDNLINADIKLDVKSTTKTTKIVKNQDLVRTNVSDNFMNATTTIEEKEPQCITEKEIFNNLLNPDYNISYIMKHLCKSASKSLGFKSDTGKALLLTDYIKKGKTKEGRTASKVDSHLFLGIKSYSGFFTVNETYNSNIFFWYFPVLNLNISESPWIIWLQGGPGASSLTGLFDEIGPFTVANNSLKLNPYTWLQNHSLLFIDNPVGTGYSFTEHEDGYVTDMTGYTDHLYSTLVQFLQVFPELKGVPLYIAGESYAGKYVPAMGMEIYRRNQTKENPDINLKGMIIGNAYVDPDMISHLVWPFYYFGLLDKQQVEIVKPLLDSFNENIKANRSIEAKEKWNNLITVVLFMTHQRHAYNFLDDEVPMGRYIGFLKSPKIKKAIHVGDIKFGFVNMTVNSKLAPDFLSTTKPLFEKLLEHYKVLSYCGQLDQMLPCVFTSENYRTWKWNGTDEFIRSTRLPYMYNNRLAGYHKSGGHFTEVVIRGAGHMVPLDKPAPTQNLVTRWTHDKALSVRFGLLQSSFVQEYVRNNSMIYL